MKSIYKYVLQVADCQIVQMPINAKILKVALQKGWKHHRESNICVWAEVNLEEPNVGHVFNIYGTGWEVEEFKGTYIGTVDMDPEHPYIWHVYKEDKVIA